MAYRIRDGVVLVKIQNVYLIVASAPCWDKCPYITQTNEMGALIWNSLLQNKELQDIVNIISEEYDDIDVKLIEHDVNLFIQNLLESNYITREFLTEKNEY